MKKNHLLIKPGMISLQEIKVKLQMRVPAEGGCDPLDLSSCEMGARG